MGLTLVSGDVEQEFHHDIQRDFSLCCSLLRKKYLGHKCIFQIRNRKGSQFWRSLLDVREWYQRGRGVRIRAGHQTRFWHDCWLGDCPLKIRFPNIFRIVSVPDLEVAKAYVNGQWHVEFRRQLNAVYIEEWIQLLEVLSNVELSEGKDEVIWLLENLKSTQRNLYTD